MDPDRCFAGAQHRRGMNPLDVEIDGCRYFFYNFSILYISHLNNRVDPVENRSGRRENKD